MDRVSDANVRYGTIDGGPLKGKQSGDPGHGAGIAAFIRKYLDIGNTALVVDSDMHVAIAEALEALTPWKAGYPNARPRGLV